MKADDLAVPQLEVDLVHLGEPPKRLNEGAGANFDHGLGASAAICGSPPWPRPASISGLRRRRSAACDAFAIRREDPSAGCPGRFAQLGVAPSKGEPGPFSMTTAPPRQVQRDVSRTRRLDDHDSSCPLRGGFSRARPRAAGRHRRRPARVTAASIISNVVAVHERSREGEHLLLAPRAVFRRAGRARLAQDRETSSKTSLARAPSIRL